MNLSLLLQLTILTRYNFFLSIILSLILCGGGGILPVQVVAGGGTGPEPRGTPRQDQDRTGGTLPDRTRTRLVGTPPPPNRTGYNTDSTPFTVTQEDYLVDKNATMLCQMMG